MRAFLVLVLTACGCAHVLPPGGYQAAILVHPTMPGALATTTCSHNNLPIILVDSQTVASPDFEIVLAHEQVHAVRAYAYRGGCWPFMYRIAKDKTFRVKEQFLAFCESGKFALTRNRKPDSVWLYIVNVMRPDTLLTAADNCLFEEPPE